MSEVDINSTNEIIEEATNLLKKDNKKSLIKALLIGAILGYVLCLIAGSIW